MSVKQSGSAIDPYLPVPIMKVEGITQILLRILEEMVGKSCPKQCGALSTSLKRDN
jgi:hypothetical protein